MINSTFDCVFEHVKNVKPSSDEAVAMARMTSQYGRQLQFNCDYFANPSVDYFSPSILSLN